MSTLLWIVIFACLMSCIALTASLTLLLWPNLGKGILPLVSFAAGSLIGGALLHMIPAAVKDMGNVTAFYVWLAAGFILFFALEQFLNWHHSHTHGHACNPLSPPHRHTNCQHTTDRSITHIDGLDRDLDCDNKSERGSIDENHESNSKQTSAQLSRDIEQTNLDANDVENAQGVEHSANYVQGQSSVSKQPLTYLILIADTVHNFLGGLFVGASFVDSIELGLSAWVAAAAHEVPQELGDFAVLVHGGWSKRQALLYNFLSSLTFLLGGHYCARCIKKCQRIISCTFRCG